MANELIELGTNYNFVKRSDEASERQGIRIRLGTLQERQQIAEKIQRRFGDCFAIINTLISKWVSKLFI